MIVEASGKRDGVNLISTIGNDGLSQADPSPGVDRTRPSVRIGGEHHVMDHLGRPRTIRGKVALAFMVTGLVTALVALGSVWMSKRSGEIATRAYDETVTATSSARAIASDFEAMRVEAEHVLRERPETRAREADPVQALHRSFLRELDAVASILADAEVAETASRLRASEAEWLARWREPSAGRGTPGAPDDRAGQVEKGIDWLSRLVAGRALTNRDDTRVTTSFGMTVTIAAAAAACVICGLTSMLIARGVTVPLRASVRFAEEVARGVYDVEAPRPSNDEFGDLARSLTTMRDNLVRALRTEERSGQLSRERVDLALEGAAEGVLIVTGDGTVQIANGPLLLFLGLPPRGLPPGFTFADLKAAAAAAGADRAALLSDAVGDGRDVFQSRLCDGRWVHVSRRRTDEGALVAILADVSEARRQQDALTAAKENLDGALANMSQGLAVFEADGSLRLSNARFHELTRTEPPQGGATATHAALAEAAARARGGDADQAARFAAVEAAWCRRRHTTTRTVAGAGFAMAVVHARMPDGGFILTVEDVTQQKAAESRIQFLADHDGLTGLPNRLLMRQKVEEALAHARRGRGFAFHALDLDRFKAVNDTMGHAAGDDLLIQVAERLRACSRDTDVVARLGGDEFAILETGVDDETDTLPLARRVIAALGAPFTVMGVDVSIGVSIGTALAPRDGTTQGEMVTAADQALYRSKEEGRGIHSFFAEEMNERSRVRRELETDLRAAVAEGALELHYQPLLDVRSMRIGGFEALMRWHHPRRGWVSPADFIPIAEETGLIREMGAWTLEHACREATGWADQAYLAVNVSAVQLRDAGFRRHVLDALVRSGLPASRLELEITESCLIRDPAKTAAVMGELRESGVRFALDDFGTGWSSLSSLHSFPFTRIKVDRSFVGDLGNGGGAEQIIKAVVLLGHNLSMQVTAEGVETRAQLAFLEGIGADTIQGWIIGRAVPGSAIPGLLALHNKMALVA